jgi:V/A-type H+/Na+-transporting ATPase subunit K
MAQRLKLAAALSAVVLLLSAGASIFLWVVPALAAQPTAAAAGGQAMSWGLLAAALATGLSSLAAGYAVATVGTAAVGALTEKPELLGRLLIFVGLAEGIAIYGLIVSVLILERLG